MKIAIPVENNQLFSHFGHCPAFALIEIDETSKKILSRTDLDAPPHEPGLLPPWLAERGVNLVVAGGIGARASDLFAKNGIKVISGVASASPEAIVSDFLSGTLKTGANCCNH
ncbi:MAG: NifB/NifX family molybdenum-iron cluster-binding protein [Alphaproteobacteria bacterium]|nr:NifB/NifX family molybdenum-iron cluster-binding protein [Alphaproteobacteria bacterium]